MFKEKIEKELQLPEISVVSLLDHLIGYAHEYRASDIHIDPVDKIVRVRFRIDGVLHDKFTLPHTVRSEIISRIKILASLRTDEHQSAQDGRFRSNIENLGPVDIRVSITPTYFGENAVLRLLVDNSQQFSLENLGFNEKDINTIKKAASRPYGMILSTGPTGSGKTTTLYTILKDLNRPEVAIVTIEDPIEYAVTGLKQIQVNSRSGLTFANGLRSILRQDPNIIMVGEIRDQETAGLAVNTALTGHLLFSTVHTNDAATTLVRLIDLKLEPFLIASTVNVAIGQRLVRKICENCKQSRGATALEEKSLLEVMPGTKAIKEIWHGVGCDNCANSGYKGRVIINEVLEISENIREAILRHATSSEIKDIAVKNGMVTMVEDGFTKAVNGITSFEEVLRVIHE